MKRQPLRCCSQDMAQRSRQAVRAFKQAGAPSVFVTGTADKERGFSFSGFAQVVSLGAAFDKRLFANEYALAEAAEACGARYLLLCDGSWRDRSSVPCCR